MGDEVGRVEPSAALGLGTLLYMGEETGRWWPAERVDGVGRWRELLIAVAGCRCCSLSRYAAASPGTSGSCMDPGSNVDDDTVRGRVLVTPPGTPATPDPTLMCQTGIGLVSLGKLDYTPSRSTPIPIHLSPSPSYLEWCCPRSSRRWPWCRSRPGPRTNNPSSRSRKTLSHHGSAPAPSAETDGSPPAPGW